MSNNMPKESNFVSAVVYLENREETVETFLKMIYDVLHENFKKFEIICVDDACGKEVCNAASRMAEQVKKTELTIVHMSNFHGCEAAMQAGADLAIGDFVFEFETIQVDYRPELIMDVYRRALEGFDVVCAVPDHEMRRSSRLFYGIFNRFAKLPYPLRTERFRIISRRVINRIHDTNRKIIYRNVAYATCGLKNDSIVYPVSGKIRINRGAHLQSKRFNMAVDSIVMFTDVAFRASFMLSIIMALFALTSLLYTILVFLIGRPVAGWTTTMFVLSSGFAGIFALLMFMSKYMSILVRLQVQRKEYSFESVEKVTKN